MEKLGEDNAILSARRFASERRKALDLSKRRRRERETDRISSRDTATRRKNLFESIRRTSVPPGDGRGVIKPRWNRANRDQ